MYKKYCLNFQSTQDSLFFLLSCLSIYKMVDSEYSIDTYKSIKICIGTTMRNLEMLKLIPDHLKIKQICNEAVLKLIPDWFVTSKMLEVPCAQIKNIL